MDHPAPVTASLVIPAHDEAVGISRLLDQLAEPAATGEFEVVVVCNGCADNTAQVARRYPGVVVLESDIPSKSLALRLGDGRATAFPRLYVDADIELTSDAVRSLAAAVRPGAALAAGPTRVLALDGVPWLVRVYYGVWERLPQVQAGLFGRGVIAMSREAHDRVVALPDAMSDDLAISEAFAPVERAVVEQASVVIRVPRTVRDLLRRRIRVHQGNAELDGRSGRSVQSQTSVRTLAVLARRQPRLVPGIVVFLAVAVAGKLGARRRIRRGDVSWQRDVSSREEAMGGDWDGMVVIASGSLWDGPAMSERLLAQELVEHAPILFVDPPRSFTTALRDPVARRRFLSSRLTYPQPGIARLITWGPPGITRPGLRAVNAWWLGRSTARARRRLRGSAHALVVASLENLFGCCDEAVSVLYGTDDFIAGGALMGVSPSWLRAREPRQIARADVLVAVSEPLALRWRAHGRDVAVIPNGCNAQLYAGVDEADDPDDVTLPRPIAGFVGHLSERIDLRCLEAVADSGHSVLLVGPRQATFDIERMSALLARPNVQWIGPRPSDELPSYLKVMAVGLTPYVDTDFNRASYPLKTLEYLAAGRPAVTTDLPSARTLPSDMVRIAADPREFAALAVAELEHGPSIEPGLIREYAATQSWAERAKVLAELIGTRGRPQ